MTHKLDKCVNENKFGSYNRKSMMYNIHYHKKFTKYKSVDDLDISHIIIEMSPVNDMMIIEESKAVIEEKDNDTSFEYSDIYKANNDNVDDINPIVKPDIIVEKPMPKMRAVVELLYSRERLNKILKKKEWI